jgi:hypothetical protein
MSEQTNLVEQLEDLTLTLVDKDGNYTKFHFESVSEKQTWIFENLTFVKHA